MTKATIRQYCTQCKDNTEFVKRGFKLYTNGQKTQQIQCKKCGSIKAITPKKTHKPFCENGNCLFIPDGIQRYKNMKVERQQCTLCDRRVRILPKCPKCNNKETVLTLSQKLECRKCGHSVIIWAKDAKGWIAATQ